MKDASAFVTLGPSGPSEEYSVAREKKIIIVILKYNITLHLLGFHNTANTFLLEYINIQTSYHSHFFVSSI